MRAASDYILQHQMVPADVRLPVQFLVVVDLALYCHAGEQRSLQVLAPCVHLRANNRAKVAFECFWNQLVVVYVVF